MDIYAYPCEHASVARFETLADTIGASNLCFWRSDNLHLTTRQLIASGASQLPSDYAVQRTLGCVSSDVIVMHRAKEGEIRLVMRACREWPVRPVFAVTTPHSVEMSLAVLFEHLMFDRFREDRIRRQRLAGGDQAS